MEVILLGINSNSSEFKLRNFTCKHKVIQAAWYIQKLFIPPAHSKILPWGTLSLTFSYAFISIHLLEFCLVSFCLFQFSWHLNRQPVTDLGFALKQTLAWT